MFELHPFPEKFEYCAFCIESRATSFESQSITFECVVLQISFPFPRLLKAFQPPPSWKEQLHFTNEIESNGFGRNGRTVCEPKADA